MSTGVTTAASGNWHQQGYALFLVILIAALGGMFFQCLMKGCHIKSGSINWKFPHCPEALNIPTLVGMIVMGCLTRNYVSESVMEHYPTNMAGMLRIICLSIILLRGGLELDFAGKGLTMVLLTLLPQLFEASAAAIATRVILKFPWPLCFAHGFTLGAVSPAVVVPSMMALHKQGYGVKKGIPTSMIAASSFDDIIAITAFGVFLTVAFNQIEGGPDQEKKRIGWEVGMNLIQLAVGLFSGLFLGFMAGVFHCCCKKKTKCRDAAKLLYLMVVAIAMPIIAEKTKFSEMKFVGIIFFGYGCFRVWGHDKPENELAFIWMFCQPVLFGTVGAAVQFKNIKVKELGTGIGIIFIGLSFRWVGAFLACMESKYTNKERAFVAFGWIPKATVQAALGGVTLYKVNEMKEQGAKVPPEFTQYGSAMLTMAVFAICITAPLGAIFIAQLGPRWLSKDDPNECIIEQNDSLEAAGEEIAVFEDRPDQEKDTTKMDAGKNLEDGGDPQQVELVTVQPKTVVPKMEEGKTENEDVASQEQD